MLTQRYPRPRKPVIARSADVVPCLAICLSAVVSTVLIHALTRGITGYVELGLVVVISFVCGNLAALVFRSACPADAAPPSGHRLRAGPSPWTGRANTFWRSLRLRGGVDL